MPTKIPVGPDPFLISRKEIDALYEALEAVTNSLQLVELSQEEVSLE